MDTPGYSKSMLFVSVQLPLRCEITRKIKKKLSEASLRLRTGHQTFSAHTITVESKTKNGNFRLSKDRQT